MEGFSKLINQFIEHECMLKFENSFLTQSLTITIINFHLQRLILTVNIGPGRFGGVTDFFAFSHQLFSYFWPLRDQLSNHTGQSFTLT